MTPGGPVPRLESEYRVYATVLRRGVRVGMAVLACTFFLYVTGIVSPVVAIRDLPRYWELRAPEYLERASLPHAWGWVTLVHRGDVLNLVGVVTLAGHSIGALVGILPILFRRRDLAYLFIVVVEIMVLVLAASGILRAGH